MKEVRVCKRVEHLFSSFSCLLKGDKEMASDWRGCCRGGIEDNIKREWKTSKSKTDGVISTKSGKDG